MSKKAIYYPNKENEVKTYAETIANQLAGALGVKYGTDAPTIALLNGHKTNVPLLIQKAYDDAQQAQTTTAQKTAELMNTKIDILREVKRITNLPNWDEADAEALGIRVVHTPTDLNTVKPKITETTALPDKNIIEWLKRDMDGVIIESIVQEVVGPNPTPPGDDNPNWQKIGEDQKSPFEDTRKNISNHPELRYYRLRYVKDEKQVGLYSLIAPVLTNIL